MNKVLRWLTIAISACGAPFNLLASLLGISFLLDWMRVTMSHDPYFRWSYLLNGMFWFLLGGLGLGLAVRAIGNKNFGLVLSAVSLFLGLGAAEVLPDVGPGKDMAHINQKLLGHADHSLSDWDDAQGKFPSSEEELRKALAVRPLREPAIYFQQGKPIPYDVRVVLNATGPSLGSPPPSPGTIVYSASPDFKDYWLTITTIRDASGGPVDWDHVLFGRGPILKMHRKHHNPGEGYQPFIE